MAPAHPPNHKGTGRRRHQQQRKEPPHLSPHPANSSFCEEVKTLVQSLDLGLPTMRQVVQTELASMVRSFITSHPDLSPGEHMVAALLPNINDLRKVYRPRQEDPEAFERTNRELQLYSLLTFQMAIVQLLPKERHGKVQRQGEGSFDPLPKGVITRVAQYLGDLQLRQSFALVNTVDEEVNKKEKKKHQGPGGDSAAVEPMDVDNDDDHVHCATTTTNSTNSATEPFEEFVFQEIYTPYKDSLPITISRLYEILGIEVDDEEGNPMNPSPSATRHPLFRRPKNLAQCPDHKINLPPPRTLPPLVPQAPIEVETTKSKARDCLAAAEALFSGCTVVGSRLPPHRRAGGTNGSTSSQLKRIDDSNNPKPTNFPTASAPYRRMLKGSFALQPAARSRPKGPARNAPPSQQARKGEARQLGGSTASSSSVRAAKPEARSGHNDDTAVDVMASPVAGPTKTMSRIKRARDEGQAKVKGGPSSKVIPRKPTVQAPLLPSCIMGTPPAKMRSSSSKTAMVVEATPESKVSS